MLSKRYVEYNVANQKLNWLVKAAMLPGKPHIAIVDTEEEETSILEVYLALRAEFGDYDPLEHFRENQNYFRPLDLCCHKLFRGARQRGPLIIYNAIIYLILFSGFFSQPIE